MTSREMVWGPFSPYPSHCFPSNFLYMSSFLLYSSSENERAMRLCSESKLAVRTYSCVRGCFVGVCNIKTYDKSWIIDNKMGAKERTITIYAARNNASITLVTLVSYESDIYSADAPAQFLGFLYCLNQSSHVEDITARKRQEDSSKIFTPCH